MRRLPITTMAIAIATVGTACNPSDRPEPADVPIVAERVADEVDDASAAVVQELRETNREITHSTESAVDQLSRELGETREEFAAESKRRLDEIDQQIDDLEARAEKTGQKAEAKLRSMRARLDTLTTKVERSSEASWEKAKGEFATGLAELEASIREARRRVERAS